jgi:putative MATE family efflux protein
MKQLWYDIIESIKGSEQDYSSGRLGRAILLLSVPMVLEMVLESVFAVVDIFFVSKLGAEAVAVVGITESIMALVYALGFGLGVGATAIISRRIGENHVKEANVAAVQVILVGAFIAMLIAIPGAFFAKDLLRLMGATPQMVETGWKYTAIMNVSSLAILLLFVINAIFRSAGDAAIAMRILWVANIINIVLDPCLIYGWGPFPALGVNGAAVATTTGRSIGVIFQFYLLFRGKYRIRLHLSDLVPDFGVMLKLIKLSTGAIFQNIIGTASWIGLVRIIASFGGEVVAGYTIAIRIVVFTLLPSFGLSNAAATLVGQSLGAGKPDRAKSSVWITAFANMLLLGVFGIILALWPHFWVELFIKDPMVIKYGTEALRIMSYGYMSYAFGMVMVQAINGAGETFIPTGINFIGYWLVEIPLAYVLAMQSGFQEHGVYFAIVASETLVALIGIAYFRWGKWQLKEV